MSNSEEIERRAGDMTICFGNTERDEGRGGPIYIDKLNCGSIKVVKEY